MKNPARNYLQGSIETSIRRINELGATSTAEIGYGMMIRHHEGIEIDHTAAKRAGYTDTHIYVGTPQDAPQDPPLINSISYEREYKKDEILKNRKAEQASSLEGISLRGLLIVARCIKFYAPTDPRFSDVSVTRMGIDPVSITWSGDMDGLKLL